MPRPWGRLRGDGKAPVGAEPSPLRAGSRQLVLHAEGGQEDGQGQDSGRSLVADMVGLKKDDFDPTLVDDVAGVATFLAEAATSDVVLYI